VTLTVRDRVVEDAGGDSDTTPETVWVRPTARQVGNLGPLLLSLGTTVALARLITGGFSARVLIPLMVAIVVADTAMALATQVRLWVPAGASVAVVASLTALLLSVDPSLVDPASHHFLSGSWLSTQFHAARFALAEEGTPLPRLGGVIIGIGALGGVTAALTRAAWVLRPLAAQRGGGRTGTLAPCIAPSSALFIYSTLISSDRGRTAAAVSFLLGAFAFVTMADRRSAFVVPTRSGAATRRGRAVPRWGVSASTVLCATLALAVVIGAGVGLSGMRLSVFHVTPPGSGQAPGGTAPNGAPGGLLTGTQLLADLRTLELQESRTVILRAQSPIASYWEVGTLPTFTGTQWLPDPGSASALAGSPSVNPASLGPAALPGPLATLLPSFTARVTVVDLLSRLLPAPPHTVSVTGLSGIQRAAPVGDSGVLADTATRHGTAYSVTAWLNTTGSVEGPQLAESDPRLVPYLALPSEPAVVSQLAHAAVGSITTRAFQVQALVNWFRNGQFRYTLTPPATKGSNPLVDFLTVTKAGYCQQFAGAFGVLARSLGIPTRLAVGFLAGEPGTGATFTITGADAHVWPQVYLGPGSGWVSVEPTPTAGTGDATPLGVLEPSSGPQAAGHPTPTATPTPVPGTTVISAPGTGRGSSGGAGAGHGQHHAAHPARHGSGWLVWLAVAGGVLVVAAAVPWLVVRRRRAHGLSDAGLNPDERIVRAWERALLTLRRIGVPRHSGETPSEYVNRVRVVASRSKPALDVDADALEELALMVEQACYDPRPCSGDQAADARELASMVVGGVSRRRAQPVGAARE